MLVLPFCDLKTQRQGLARCCRRLWFMCELYPATTLANVSMDHVPEHRLRHVERVVGKEADLGEGRWHLMPRLRVLRAVSCQLRTRQDLPRLLALVDVSLTSINIRRVLPIISTLQHLSLYGISYIKPLGDLKNLKSLDLSESSYPVHFLWAGSESPADLPPSENMQELRLCHMLPNALSKPLTILRLCQRFPRLTTFCMTAGKIPNYSKRPEFVPSLRDFEALSQLPLMHLELVQMQTLDTESLQGLFSVTTLEHLNLSMISARHYYDERYGSRPRPFNNKLDWTGVEALKNLTVLNLARHVQMSDADGARIAKALPKLTRLSLFGCEEIGDLTIKSMQSHCRLLQHLNLTHCLAITSEGLCLLGQMPLVSLDLSLWIGATRAVRSFLLNIRNGIIPNTKKHSKLISMDALFGDNLCRTLESLSLDWHVNLDPTTLSKGLPRMSSLKSLSLRGIVLMQDKHLAMFHDLHTVERLELLGQYLITDQGLKRLLNGRLAVTLKSLNLSGCMQLTKRSLVPLVQSFSSLCELHLDSVADWTSNSSPKGVKLPSTKERKFQLDDILLGFVECPDFLARLQVLTFHEAHPETPIRLFVDVLSRCPRLRIFDLRRTSPIRSYGACNEMENSFTDVLKIPKGTIPNYMARGSQEFGHFISRESGWEHQESRLVS